MSNRTYPRCQRPLAAFAFALCGVLARLPVAAQAPVSFDLPAPKLVGETKDWLNTNGVKLEFEKGKVYVVEFWTFGCINCQRNLPAYARWQKQFGRRGVTIIGVHTPETDEEKQPENVQKYVKQSGITYPVLVDGAAANWRRWEQGVWPTVYLIDRRGHARYRWTGELNWNRAGGEQIMARKLELLLAEK